MTKNRTELDALATKLVGDGQTPNLFFVSRTDGEDSSIVVTVTHDFPTAWRHWRTLASRSPSLLPILEDRQHGVLARVERNETTGKLIVNDDTLSVGFSPVHTTPDLY